MNKLNVLTIGLCVLCISIIGCGSNPRVLSEIDGAQDGDYGPDMRTHLGSISIPPKVDDGGNLTCPHPSPHYKVVRNLCVPSCGVALAGRAGTMLASACGAGYTYAGLSWEEAEWGSKCCIENRTIPPNPTPTPTPPPSSHPPSTIPGGSTPTAACPFSIPPLSRINVAIHNNPWAGRYVIDTTPIVCSIRGTQFETYCQDMMQDSLRWCCPIRPEGDPTRVACENVVMGQDPTDGKYGPHFSYEGNGGGGRSERNDYQFILGGASNGKVTACSNTSPQVCGERLIP